MRVLLDTDVVLDLLLNRQPFAIEAAQLWQQSQDGAIEAHISAITPVNVFYIGRRLQDAARARRAVEKLLAGLRLCIVDEAVLHLALTAPFADYEDAVQHSCAVMNRLDAIVTRNGADYRAATLPVFAPADFLRQLNAGGRS
jgi:predicted nucleic acid-binding protein